MLKLTKNHSSLTKDYIFGTKMMKISLKMHIKNAWYIGEMSKKLFVSTTQKKRMKKIEKITFSWIFMHFPNMYVIEKWIFISIFWMQKRHKNHIRKHARIGKSCDLQKALKSFKKLQIELFNNRLKKWSLNILKSIIKTVNVFLH